MTALSVLSHPLTSSSTSGIGACVSACVSVAAEVAVAARAGGLDAMVAYDEAILVCIGTCGLGIRADSFLFRGYATFSFGFTVASAFTSFGASWSIVRPFCYM